MPLTVVQLPSFLLSQPEHSLVTWQPNYSFFSAPTPPTLLHHPGSPHTHGRCWEDGLGGAGHEVRDLPQGPDVGGVVPLLHLLLDETFELLPERLKQNPRL